MNILKILKVIYEVVGRKLLQCKTIKFKNLKEKASASESTSKSVKERRHHTEQICSSMKGMITQRKVLKILMLEKLIMLFYEHFGKQTTDGKLNVKYTFILDYYPIENVIRSFFTVNKFY